jgi:CDGSH-type Zn-finger protein
MSLDDRMIVITGLLVAHLTLHPEPVITRTETVVACGSGSSTFRPFVITRSEITLCVS